MSPARRGQDLRRTAIALQHIGTGSRNEWWRRFSRQTGALEQRAKFSGPKLIDFVTQLLGSIVDRHAQPGFDINQNFSMHVALLDRRYARNEPALDTLWTGCLRQVT